MSDWGVGIDGAESLAAGLDETADSMTNVTYIVGTNVEYSVSLEYGNSEHPPYPFLGPAVDDVMGNRADDLIDNADSIEDAIRDIAFAIEERAKYYTDDGPPGPDKITGNLHRSIAARRLD